MRGDSLTLLGAILPRGECLPRGSGGWAQEPLLPGAGVVDVVGGARGALSGVTLQVHRRFIIMRVTG